MAAIFALIFLFVVASIGLMLKALPSTLGFGTVLAAACFVALAVGVFIGLFNLARRWENETPIDE